MQLGENPWFLIGLIFLETLLVFIPALISSKIEKKTFKKLLSEMGFQRNEEIFIKIIAGLSMGILLFFLGNLLILFFRNIIVENLFGAGFIEQGQEGAITTTPIQPDVYQLSILIILQIIIIAPCEEAFFRAFIIKKFQVKIKLIYSILISSTFFAFYHVPPMLVPVTTIVTFFGYYFIIGVILALIFLYFNFSIIPCSVAHSCFNILVLLI
ncbi:MAG: CPBP family intramembrane metalloprotease [Candidatus Lokiarchaeota archaeon]|nr:CPBP family intramembrane metalloprotease [Candidatus Lokiarchaeota archaeon]